MNAMVMGEIGTGILTGLGLGMVAFCVAILIEASLEFMFSDISEHPRSAAMLRALPLLVPAGFDAVAILPARGALVAIQQLSDPTLPHPRVLSQIVLAVCISYLLIVRIFPNLGTEYIPAHFDSPAVEAAPGEFPTWASDLISVETLLRHRQWWGDPARRLRVDHAVLYGRLLLVVESHLLPGGSWSHSADGLRAHGTAGAPIGLSAARAAHRMQCRFRCLRVRALVVVHCADVPSPSWCISWTEPDRSAREHRPNLQQPRPPVEQEQTWERSKSAAGIWG